MPRKPRAPRPSEVVMDEFAGKQTPWDLEKHLNGCLAGYQADPSYGAAVFFALEALWGISHDGELLARNGKLTPEQLDADWIIAPKTNLPVPWIWIHSLATAWDRYKTRGGPLGHAFGLEGGQGKSPTIDKLAQMLDERAIARWVWSRLQEARATDKEFRIEDVVQEAAEEFDKSDGSIRRAWQRFGDLERLRPPE
jgi:hypothetical protein